MITIHQPRADLMFNFDYAFSIAHAILEDGRNLLGKYTIESFELVKPDGKTYAFVFASGDNLRLYIQYEFVGNEIMTIVNPTVESFNKWVEKQRELLIHSDDVKHRKDLVGISSVFYRVLNAYEMASENGILSWAYLTALTRHF